MRRSHKGTPVTQVSVSCNLSIAELHRLDVIVRNLGVDRSEVLRRGMVHLDAGMSATFGYLCISDFNPHSSGCALIVPSTTPHTDAILGR